MKQKNISLDEQHKNDEKSSGRISRILYSLNPFSKKPNPKTDSIEKSIPQNKSSVQVLKQKTISKSELVKESDNSEESDIPTSKKPNPKTDKGKEHRSKKDKKSLKPTTAMSKILNAFNMVLKGSGLVSACGIIHGATMSYIIPAYATNAATSALNTITNTVLGSAGILVKPLVVNIGYKVYNSTTDFVEQTWNNDTKTTFNSSYKDGKGIISSTIQAIKNKNPANVTKDDIMNGLISYVLPACASIAVTSVTGCMVGSALSYVTPNTVLESVLKYAIITPISTGMGYTAYNCIKNKSKTISDYVTKSGKTIFGMIKSVYPRSEKAPQKPKEYEKAPQKPNEFPQGSQIKQFTFVDSTKPYNYAEINKNR